MILDLMTNVGHLRFVPILLTDKYTSRPFDQHVSSPRWNLIQSLRYRVLELFFGLNSHVPDGELIPRDLRLGIPNPVEPID